MYLMIFINYCDECAMIPNLDVDQLKTFLAIADLGNFTRAAEEVNKTQSAVSMQMKRLEEVIGRPLFARDGRGSRFTSDGERLIEYARRIVALSNETVSAFTQPEINGTVRLGTPDDYADVFLPEVLARFSRTHPQVTVDVECFSSSILVERTQHGEMDLAIVSCGAHELYGEVLRKEELVWVTSSRHDLHLRDELPLAVSHITCSWRKIVTNSLDQIGRKYRVAYSSPNSATLNAAVLQGLAIAALPQFCIKPGMRMLTAADGFPPLSSFAISLMLKPGKPSAAAAALAAHVKDALCKNRQMMAAA
jgi:DNA-binding transcriptional LysR family regulator